MMYNSHDYFLGLPMYFACICMYDRTSPQKPAEKNVGDSNGTLTTLVYEDDVSKKFDELVAKESSLPRRISNDIAVIKVEDEILESSQADDEKSVIAMLDDVIQHEEQLLAPGLERSMSANSSLVDTVEASTVAIVHSQIIAETLEADATLESQVNLTEEDVKQVAEEFVDQILKSDEIAVVLEKLSEDKRKQSLASQGSATSTSDPIHSENFKKKLSRLISSPHVPLNTHKSQENPQDETKEKDEERLPIRTSKSAEDVHKLLSAAIANNRSDEKENGGIPKPPKFDPVLYKTINSPYQLQSKTAIKIKNRPSIKEIVAASNPVPNDDAVSSVPNFKAKLEEILKTGPSLKSSSTQSYMERNGIVSPIIRRKSSTNDDNYKNILRTIRANKVLSLEKHRIDKNNNHVENGSAIIESTRKSLKPIS